MIVEVVQNKTLWHCKIEVGHSGGLADLAAGCGAHMPVYARARVLRVGLAG
jgi:hypothetical protein